MKLTILTFLVVVVGLLGSWLSVQVRAGWPWWLPILAGIGSYGIWSIAAKTTTSNLVALSAWFDVVVALAWFAGFWLCGERIAVVQWVGVGLLALGLGLINWR